MRRVYFIYAAVVLASLAGLWAILAAGAGLSAPHDLSGRWIVAWDAGADAGVGDRVLVEQSGQYHAWTFGDGRRLELRGTQGTDERPFPVRLQGPDGGVTVSLAAQGRYRVELQGALAGSGEMRREDGATAGSSGAPKVSGKFLLTLLAQVGVILFVSRAMGYLFAQLHQPQVMGEMVAGILLGPSLLGWLFPAASAALFPPGSAVYLNVLSQVGVIFFLFLIGLELNPKLLRHRGHAAVVISHVSIIAPFFLGAALAGYLYPRVFNSTPSMRFTSVALFMGAAMSVTAFPVLARILTERNLHKTKVGAVTITCAAVDDVSAWCLLAFVVGIAQASGPNAGLVTACLAGIYVLAMLLLVRPLLGRLQALYERRGRLSQNVVAVIFLLTIASAYATEAIGIHALFGAFLMGAIMPKGTRFVRHLAEKLEDYTVVLLLPIFFAYTGLQTRIGLLNSGELWLLTGVIIAIACLGKFGGSMLAARACGLEWRESSAIGVLMNTRGLMELVILSIGRELGVITDAVFAMLVIMAIVTTFMTTPLLQWVYPERLFGAPMAIGEALRRTFSVLVPVSDPRSGEALIRVADLLCGLAQSPRRLIALHLRRPVDHEAYRAGLDAPAAEADPTGPLGPLLATARTRNIAVETMTFVSREIPEDIAAIAARQGVNLVLMGFHRPVFGRALLGGVVHRVLTSVPADAAIFVDRGFSTAGRILVPFLGGAHDRLALELAGRIGRASGGTITVLHVVPPIRGEGSRPLNVKQEVERAFAEPGQPQSVTFRVVEDESPVAVVLCEAREADLVVIGVAEEWGLESQLFGWRPQRIARDCPSSLLIVRRGAQAPGVPLADAQESAGAAAAPASAAEASLG